jgi:ethanolamine utilization protein EutA
MPAMHDTDFPHDHEEFYAQAVELEGMESIALTSVGIDIGSSTTHLLFSRLTLRREGAAFSTRYSVSDRAILWSSPILLTPYRSPTEIDFAAVRAFIEQGYAAAGLTPDMIDSGAVVITGEALKKENARPIAEYVAEQSGKFVCASAGPHHEALLAAHGSGAVHLSRATRSTILNIDIGGGTTKLSLIRNGQVERTAAISIGARLVAFDADGRIERLEEAGRAIGESVGIILRVGDILPPHRRERLAARMADTLLSTLEHDKGVDLSPLAAGLMITAPLAVPLDAIDYIVFSGGVSEYIHGRSVADYGDLGPLLGAALARFVARQPAGSVLEPVQGIRATVIGAGEYSVQVSGMTGFSTDSAPLPLFGLKVVRAAYDPDTLFSETIATALRKFDLDAFEPGLMIATSIDGDIGYRALRRIADGIAECASADPGAALIVTVEQDVAHSLGRILREELHVANPLVVIDGILVGDLDYVDIGRPIGAAGVFPVTVKSLLFSSEPLL